MAWTVVWACDGIIVTFHCTFIVANGQIRVATVTNTFIVGIGAIAVTFCDFIGPIFSTFRWNGFSGRTEIGEVFENWTGATVWTLFVTWTLSFAFSFLDFALVATVDTIFTFGTTKITIV
jgi:hypothetical protein